MSRIRANTITNQNANGAPNFPDGITVSGIVTATTTNQNITGDLTVSGNIGVGGTLTYEDVTNIDSIGIITARAGINVSSGDINVSSGKIGISSIIPASKLTVKGGSIFVGDNNMHGGSAGIIEYGGGTGHFDLKAYSMGGTTNLRLFTSTGGTSSERLRIGSAGQIGIAGANYGTSGQVLTSQGASSAVQWATVSTPVKEQFLLSCDGSSVSTSNGTYTTTNVTGIQTLNGDNTTTFTGSQISYQPPTGTTCVIYEFISSFGAGDSDGIWNTVLYIDGNQVKYSTLTSRGYNNGSCPLYFRWAINIGGSANNDTGRQANWNSAKTLLLRVRDYDSNHDQNAHVLQHNQFGGGNFKQPQIGITAIG